MVPGSNAPLVLLVDDEPDHVEMYQLALELSGFRVVAANGGARALELARSLQPAAVVLDLRLPDLSGWDVVAAMRGDARTSGVRVVLLTAAASPTLPEDAEKAGCDACLTKPCVPDLLTHTVRAVIAGRAPSA